MRADKCALYYIWQRSNAMRSTTVLTAVLMFAHDISSSASVCINSKCSKVMNLYYYIKTFAPKFWIETYAFLIFKLIHIIFPKMLSIFSKQWVATTTESMTHCQILDSWGNQISCFLDKKFCRVVVWF